MFLLNGIILLIMFSLNPYNRAQGEAVVVMIRPVCLFSCYYLYLYYTGYS